jgi:hypothetical protein
MAKKPEPRPEPKPVPKRFVLIRAKKETVRCNTQSYWRIVGETQFMGESRIDAIDAAKWALFAKLGETRTLPNGTTMEITES